MLGRIVEVANDRRHLSADRGFMRVQSTEQNSVADDNYLER